MVLYRIEAAKEDLKSAKILRDSDSYKGANNRAYYAIFHAINAVHGLRGDYNGKDKKRFTWLCIAYR